MADLNSLHIYLVNYVEIRSIILNLRLQYFGVDFGLQLGPKFLNDLNIGVLMIFRGEEYAVVWVELEETVRVKRVSYQILVAVVPNAPLVIHS